MNKIINKFSLTGDKFMPKFHSKPRFTYSACVIFTKYLERIQKFRETGNLKHLYGNELDNACFAHDARYSDSKELAKQTVSDNISKDKAYEVSRNCKYDGYQRVLASMVCKLIDKKTISGVGVKTS